MSIDATRWAWTQQVTPSLKIVLLSLADRADEDGYCYPSIKRLMLDCSMQRRTVQKKLAELESLGLIVRKSRFTEHGQSSNDYWLNGVIDRHSRKQPSPQTARRKPQSPPVYVQTSPRVHTDTPPAFVQTSPRVHTDTPPASVQTSIIINEPPINHQKKKSGFEFFKKQKAVEHHETQEEFEARKQRMLNEMRSRMTPEELEQEARLKAEQLDVTQRMMAIVNKHREQIKKDLAERGFIHVSGLGNFVKDDLIQYGL